MVRLEMRQNERQEEGEEMRFKNETKQDKLQNKRRDDMGRDKMR